MRKITLFLMSLFLTVGAMAQTAIDVTKYYRVSNQKDGESVKAWTYGDLKAGLADVDENDMNQVWQFVAGEGDNADKYLIKHADSERYMQGVGGDSGVSLTNPNEIDKAVYYFVRIDENGKYEFYHTLDGEPRNCLFNDGNNKLAGWREGSRHLWTLTECTFEKEEKPAEVVVNNVEDLNNNKVYNLITTRGWLIYNEKNADVVASTASYGTFTTGKDVEACQWAIYKSEKNKYYLYNIAAAKFVGSNSDEAGLFPFVANVTNDIQVVKSTTGTVYALVFSTDNYGAINHFNHPAEPGVANWRGNDSQGGLRALSDEGSAHKVVEVADIAPATLNAIAEAVAKFETDNTSAVAKLDVALANAQTLFGKIKVGTEMGEYTATDADYESKFNSIVAFRQAIQSTNTPTPAEVEAKIGEIDAIIASFQLNLPEAGKYYRIMAVEGWNDDARYLGAQNSTANTSRAEFVAEADDNTVFYFDGEYLKSNATGYYLVSNSNFLGYNGEQTEGSVIAFHAASNNLIGAYNISFNDGTRWLYCNQNNFTDAGGSTNDVHGYCFNIEEVEVVVEPETPTAIENVETEAENAEIYDLTGRKVENITKAGIYIVNGCKVLVK